MAAWRAAAEVTRGVRVDGAAPVSPLAERTLPARSRLTTSSPPMTGMAPRTCWKRTEECPDSDRLVATWSSRSASAIPNALPCWARNARATVRGGADALSPAGRGMGRPAAVPTKRTWPVARWVATCTPRPSSRLSASADPEAAPAGAARLSIPTRAKAAARIRFIGRSSPTPTRPRKADIRLGDDPQRLRLEREADLDLVGDVVAVDLDRHRPAVDR